MNLSEFYEQIPAERHHEVILSGDRLYFGDEEFIIDPEGNIHKIHSWKEIHERLDRIERLLKKKPGKTEIVKLEK